MIKSASAGGVILNKRNEVLVVNQRGRSWSLPKGHVEENETLLQAAKREIEEETGVSELELIKEFKPYKRFRTRIGGGDDKSKEKTLYFFLFKTNQEELKPIDPHNPEAKWVKIEEVSDLLTHPKDKDFFNSILTVLS